MREKNTTPKPELHFLAHDQLEAVSGVETDPNFWLVPPPQDQLLGDGGVVVGALGQQRTPPGANIQGRDGQNIQNAPGRDQCWMQRLLKAGMLTCCLLYLCPRRNNQRTGDNLPLRTCPAILVFKRTMFVLFKSSIINLSPEKCRSWLDLERFQDLAWTSSNRPNWKERHSFSNAKVGDLYKLLGRAKSNNLLRKTKFSTYKYLYAKRI